MSKPKHSDFARRERNFIETRCEQLFESITAMENEFKLLESRMEAIDTLEKLYMETEEELESTRATLDRINQLSFGVADHAVSEPLRRTHSIRSNRSGGQIKIA